MTEQLDIRLVKVLKHMCWMCQPKTLGCGWARARTQNILLCHALATTSTTPSFRKMLKDVKRVGPQPAADSVLRPQLPRIAG